MIDWDTALYDPLFGVFGVVASLDTGTLVDVTVIDQTAGIEIAADAVGLPVISPVALVRVAELDDNGLGEEDLLEATLTIRGNAWTIKNVAAKPGPDGKGTGELMLMLINGDL
ncbi:MAG: hypothetical protein WAP47_08815 [Candidatus Rokuibacteriota bacterium]